MSAADAAKLFETGKTHVSTIGEITGLVNKGRQWYRKHTQWTVTISSADTLYDIAHAWFTDTTRHHDKPPKALQARFGATGSAGVSYDEEDLEEHPITFYYDDKTDREIDVYGHAIRISMQKPNHAATKEAGVMAELMSSIEPNVLTFYAKSREGQYAVIRKLRELASSKEDHRPCLRMLNNWGNWSRRDDIPPRALSSVVLREGQMERIRDDLQTFLDSEKEYNVRGIPWHRGILLYGPPGTGKTSIVKAVAHDLGLDLWYAPLGDIGKDTSLLNIVSEVKPRSILLLEDFDVFHAAREREDSTGKASMAALLNALDGVATPHGMITILTTNKLESIDEALIRPGRVDLLEEIGLPDGEQVRRLYETFYREPFSGRLPRELGTTARYMEIFKQHMHDPAGALAEITI